MLPKLIGLTGYKGSGKDTVALVLSTYGYQRVAFADPLKAIATVLGWNGDKAERERCEHCGMLQGRELLQVLGTEGVRANIRDDAWLLAAERSVALHNRVVVTDVRFPNEADFIRSHGGEVWRVLRPGHEGDGHASETSQSLIAADFTIENSQAIFDLEVQVHRVMRNRQATTSKAVSGCDPKAAVGVRQSAHSDLDPGLSAMVNS